jgi:hypothetical protein
MRQHLSGLRPEAERSVLSTMDSLERRIKALESNPPAEQALLTADFVAREGQTVFVGAPAAGIKGLLPAPRQQNRGARVLLCFTTTGPVILSCVAGTVNGAASITSRVVGAYLAVCDGQSGWYVEPFVEGHAIWGALTLGTLQTEASKSGAITVTLASGVTRLLITTTANATLSTISGAADGRVLLLSHDRASGSGNLIITSSTGTDGIACPNNRYTVIPGRGTVLLIGRGTTWYMHVPARAKGVVQSETGGGSQNNYALTDDADILLVTSASLTLTGLARATQNLDGDSFYIQCDDGITCTIPFNSGSSSAGNRVAGPNAQTLVLPSRSLTQFVYRSLLWRAQLVAADPNIVGPELSSLSVPFVIRVPFSAAAAGTADDVTIYNATAPFGFRVIDCHVKILTAIGGSTVTLRSASGGGGSALSSALSSAATGTARNNDTDSRTVASGGSLFLRRSDRGVAGEITIDCIRT